MKNLLVLYYSMYGHIETLANAVVAGAQSVDGVEVTPTDWTKIHYMPNRRRAVTPGASSRAPSS